MDRRLRLAKRLLNPDASTLVVTIDEKEIHRLGLLLDQVFPGAKRQMVTIVINPNGSARKAELARVEEYAFFVFIGDAAPCRVGDTMLGDEQPSTAKRAAIRWEWLLRGGAGANRADRPNLFYPIYVDPGSSQVVDVGDPLLPSAPRSEVPVREGLVAVWPLRTNGDEGRWRVSRDSFVKMLDSGHAKVGAYDRKNNRYSMLYLGQAQIRRIERGEITVTGRGPQGEVLLEAHQDLERTATPKTVWSRPAHKAGEYGSSMVKRLTGGRAFPFPKSLYSVEDTLRVMVADNSAALVLDFFAGSGTTAHALARLNHQDGGRRRSITVTNNEVAADEANSLRARRIFPGSPEWEERGICEFITIPRITAAITGRTPVGDPVAGEYAFGERFPISEGLPENVEFFELTYEDGGLVSLGRRFEAIAPLLWLKAGAVGPRIEQIDTEQGWALPEGASYAVLFDPQLWAGFVEAVNQRQDDTRPVAHVFIVTDSLNEFQQIVSRLDSSQPATRLYSDFLRTFEINTSSAR